MKLEDMLSLDARHFAGLRAFYETCPFDDVEIVVHEKAWVETSLGQPVSKEFNDFYNSLRLEGIIGSGDRTFVIFNRFADTNEDYSYLVSFVSDGTYEDRVIFRIINY